MKLTDVAKGLFKKLTAPKSPQVTHHRQPRTSRPPETALPRATRLPTESTTRQPRRTSTIDQPKTVKAPVSQPAPKGRTGIADEYVRKGRAKHKWGQGERKVAPDNPLKKQVKRFWEKFKPGEKEPKEPIPKQRQPQRRPLKPAQPAQPKHKGRPIGAKDIRPRKQRTPKAPVIPEIPTELAPVDREPADGSLNVLEWVINEANTALNSTLAAKVVEMFWDAVENADDPADFFERVSIAIVENDVSTIFTASYGDQIFASFITLSAILGVSISEEDILNAMYADGIDTSRLYGSYWKESYT